MTRGFEAIVGNPPFAGSTTLTASTREGYSDWLRTVHPRSGGKCDVVAHFFRAGFRLLSGDGTMGLVATNTISQGDTRKSGLSAILREGGSIYAATRRLRWPGRAKVVVSVIHISRTPVSPRSLDGRRVARITPFLYDKGSEDEPAPLKRNEHTAYIGCKPGSKGFVFEDGSEGANPVAVMNRLLEDEPSSRAIVRPYLGGAEMNDSPTLTPSRWIVHFGSRTLAEAEAFPTALALLKKKVKPFVSSEKWWQFARSAADFYSRCPRFERVLVIAEVSDTFAFTFQRPDIVFSNKLVLFLLDQWDSFGVLQSRLHECWARLLSSTMKDDLTYVPADAFDTFPFPVAGPAASDIGDAARRYYEFRAALMARNDEGLTKSYNRFHDPNERAPDILKLRELHAVMDRAVLDAYGWSDIQPVYDFREQLDESIRLTWADDTRDEVLARLLELNRVRAEAERQDAAEAAAAPKSAPKQKVAKKSSKSTKAAKAKAKLFDEGEG